MANTKIRATAELFLDTSNASSDAKKFVNDLKRQLNNIETAADKMTVFQDLVGYIAQIDKSLAALKTKNGDAFNHMFDGMDASFRTEFEKIFGIAKDKLTELNSLRTVINNATPENTSTDQLKEWEKTIKDIYALMGQNAALSGRGKFDTRIKNMKSALDDFAHVWKNTMYHIEQGFNFGGSGTGSGGDGIDDLSNKIDTVKNKIKELENEISKVSNIKKELEKAFKAVGDFNTSGDLSKDLQVEMTVDSVRKLMTEYVQLSKVIKNQDATADDYYSNLIKQSQLAMQIVNMQDRLQTAGSDNKTKNVLSQLKDQKTKNGHSLYSNFTSIANKAFEDLNGTFESRYNDFINNLQQKQSELDRLYVDLNDMLAKQGKSPVNKNGQGSNGDKVESQTNKNKELALSYDELSKKVKEYTALQQKINDGLELDDDGMDLEEKIRQLDEFFISLDKTGSKVNEIQKILGDLSFGDIVESDALEQLSKMLNIQKEILHGSEAVGGSSAGASGVANAINANVDFSSLENTIRAEAASLSNKLNSILRVEVVNDNTKNISNVINDINSTIGKISAAIDSYKSLQQTSQQQSEIDTMKANLTQFLKFVSDFNAKKVDGQYQRQEIGAAIMSDGSISTTYGENGTVPWDRMASSLVANLTKSLLVDVHSHPWSQFPNGHRLANDHFSGSYGDLGAFRLSKELGAKLGAMITGNVMRVFDVSKLTDKQMVKFKTELADIEKTYSKKPEYSKYMSYDDQSGKVKWKMQGSFADTHKLTEAYESLMYKALERVGFSQQQIDDEIFQKYNLTDDQQLTALAERLVNLAHSSQSALSPVERLSEIIAKFGGNVNSDRAKEGFEAYQKGELNAAAVFNNLMKDANSNIRISQGTMDSLLNINTANEISATESLLTQIVGILNTIGSNVANISNSTRQNTNDRFDMAMNDLLDLREGITNKQITSAIKSIFDPLNISEYKNNEVWRTADNSVIDAKDYIQDLFRKSMQDGSVDADEAQIALDKFYLAISHVQDAMQQIDLYEQRTKKEFLDNDGNRAKDDLNDTYNGLINSNEMQSLLYLLSQAKIDLSQQKDVYKNGLGVSSTDDGINDGALLSNLQSIQSILSAIHGTLQGLTGIKANDALGIEYSKPVQKNDNMLTGGLSDNVESILSSIASSVASINSAIGLEDSSKLQQDTSIELLSQVVSSLSSSIGNLESAIQSLKLTEFDGNNKVQIDGENQQINNTSTLNEINNLDQLAVKLAEVKNAIDLKTKAFLNEATVVGQSVGKEISALKHLLEILEQITQCVNLFSSGSIPNNLFEAWKTDLSAIENNVKNIASIINGITVPEINIKDNLGSGNNASSVVENGYALETTLQGTNGILSNILGAVSGNNNLSALVTSLEGAVKELKNVANGIVQQQKASKSDTSVANARIANKDSHDHIRDVALNSLGDRALSSEVTEMKALANGVVQVTGWLQVAENAWEGFTVQVNEAGEASKLAFDANSKAAKRAAAEAEAARKASEKGSVDDNELKYNRADVEARAQAHLDQYTKEGKNATVQFKDSGRYTISILEEIGGLSRQIFQTFDENDEKIERTTATMSNKMLVKLQDLQKIAEFGRDNNLISDTDDTYRRYAEANAELERMNALYKDRDDLSNNDIVDWNTQIKLVEKLGAEVQKLVLSRKTSASDLFMSKRNKDAANFNKDYAKLKDTIEIPDSFTDRINQAGDAIKNAVDSNALEVAKNNWAALRTEIEKTAIEQDLYIKKEAASVGNRKAYGGNILLNATAKYNSLLRATQDDEFDGSSVVAQKLKEYTDAYKRLVSIQSQFKAGEDPTASQKEAFIEAKDACNKYSQELKKVIDATNKLANQSDGNVWNLGGDFQNTSEGRRAAFQEFVKEVYGAQAAITGFNKDCQQMTFSLKNSDGTFTKMTASISAAGNKIRAVAGSIKESSSMFDAIGGKMKGLWTYAAARFGVDEIFQAVRTGVQYVRDIDSALTELKKVTNETDGTYEHFLQTMSKTAGNVGSTVKDLTSSAADWSRLGYSLEEAGSLAETTAKLLNVSEFTSVDDATSALVSSLQAFTTDGQDAGRRAEEIVDVLNNIGNKYPVATNELATGLASSGAALVAANNTLEEQVAMLAAGNATMQDISTVASGLKIVAARLRGTTSEEDDDAESAITNVSKLQEKIKSLTAEANGGKGIDIINEQGEYKSTWEILSEISKIFSTMDDMSQASLLELIAGKNRSSVVAAILQNGDILDNAYNDALNSAGSSINELNTQMESVEGHINQLTNALQTMWMNFIDTKALKWFLHLGTGAIQLVDKIGLLSTALGVLFSYFSISSKVDFDLASMLGIHKQNDNFIKGFDIFGKEGLTGWIAESFDDLPNAINQQLNKVKIPINNKNNLTGNILGDPNNIEVSVQDFASVIQDNIDNYVSIDTSKIDTQIDSIQNKLSIARKELSDAKNADWDYYKLFGSTSPAIDRDNRIAESSKLVGDLEAQLDELIEKRNALVSSAATGAAQSIMTPIQAEAKSMFSVLEQIKGVKLSIGDEQNAAKQIDAISNAAKNGQAALTSYMSTLGDGDAALKAYVATVKDGNYSLAGFQQFIANHNAGLVASSAAAKASAIAHQALNVALSLCVSALASLVFSAVIKGLDAMANSAKHTAEEVKNLNDAYESAQQLFAEGLDALTKPGDSKYATLKDEFEVLASGVDKYGNNISLTADEYERYKEICDQIVGVNPKIAAGYDSNTKAIGNNVSMLEQMIELQKISARQNAADYLSDKNLETIATDKYNKLDDARDEYNLMEVFANQNNSTMAQNLNDMLLRNEYHSAYGENAKDVITNMLDRMGYSQTNIDKILEDYAYENGDYNIRGFFEDFLPEISQKEFKFQTEDGTNLISDFLKEYDYSDVDISKETAALQEAKEGLINALLQTTVKEEDFEKLGDGSQKFINEWIKNSGQFEIDPDASKSEVKEFAKNSRDTISEMIKTLADSTKQVDIDGQKFTAQDLINQIYDFDMSSETWSGYKDKINQAVSGLSELTGMEEQTIKLTLGVDFETADVTLAEKQQIVANLMGRDIADIQSLCEDMTAEEIQAFIKIDWNVIGADGINTVKDIMDAIYNEINSFGTFTIKTHADMSDVISNYNELLAQTNQITADNVEISKEYKDAVSKLGIDQTALNECFDENNGLIVKNSKQLRRLVAEKKKEIAADVRLAKAQSQLEYYELVNDLREATDGMNTFDAATLDMVNSLMSQINAVSSAVYQYQLLEDSLLGAANAFQQFAQAQQIDSLNTYGDSYIEMLQTMYDAFFETGEVGTESMWAAIKALVPESAYAGKEGTEQMEAIREYFKTKILPTVTNKEGQLSLEFGDMEDFVKKGIEKGVFEGEGIGNFSLDKFINGLQEGEDGLAKFAQQMGMTETQAYAMLATLDKYNTNSREQSFLSQIDTSLNGRIMKTTASMADLVEQRNLLYKKKDRTAEEEQQLVTINNQIKELDVVMEQHKRKAADMWKPYSEIDSVLSNTANLGKKVSEVFSEELIGEIDLEGTETVEQAYQKILEYQLQLGIPTELTVTLAKKQLEADMKDTVGALGEEQVKEIEAKLKFNVETGKWEFGEGSGFENDDQAKKYVELKNALDGIDQYFTSNVRDQVSYLSSIESILSGIAAKMGVEQPKSGEGTNPATGGDATETDDSKNPEVDAVSGAATLAGKEYAKWLFENGEKYPKEQDEPLPVEITGVSDVDAVTGAAKDVSDADRIKEQYDNMLDGPYQFEEDKQNTGVATVNDVVDAVTGATVTAFEQAGYNKKMTEGEAAAQVAGDIIQDALGIKSATGEEEDGQIVEAEQVDIVSQAAPSIESGGNGVVIPATQEPETPVGGEQPATQEEGIKLDYPENGIPLDIPENGLKLDIPEAGVKLDMPENGIKLDAPENGIKLDVPENGITLDTPENGIPLDVPEGGLPLNVPEEGVKLNVPEEGIKLNIPETGIQLDVPENGLVLDTPENGLNIDCPENGLKLDVPENGVSVDVPAEGLKINEPVDGLKLNIPPDGVGLNVPEAGIKLDTPENGLKIDAPNDGLSLNVPNEGLKINVPESGLELNEPTDGIKLNVPPDGLKINEPVDGLKINEPKDGLGLNVPKGGIPLNVPEGGIPVNTGGKQTDPNGSGQESDPPKSEEPFVIPEKEDNVSTSSGKKLTLKEIIHGLTEGHPDLIINADNAELQTEGTDSQTGFENLKYLDNPMDGIVDAVTGATVTAFEQAGYAKVMTEGEALEKVVGDALGSFVKNGVAEEENGQTVQADQVDIVTGAAPVIDGNGSTFGSFATQEPALPIEDEQLNAQDASMKLDYPENGIPIDMPENGMEVDVPDGEIPVAMPDDGIPVNIPENGIQISLPEGEGAAVLTEEQHNVSALVEGTEDVEALRDAINGVKDKSVTVNATVYGLAEAQSLENTIDGIKSKNVTITTTFVTNGAPPSTGGGGSADGTAHANGTAFSGGSWGAPRTETALVGELGPEILVRNGRWTTIGDNGAEFANIKKGDIIFNHKQTEELLSNGYVTGRGKAFAEGTAYSGMMRPINYKPESNRKKKDSDKEIVDAIKGASDDASEDFEEVFDWIEVRLEEITEQIDIRNAKLENAIGSNNQNKLIDEMIDLNKQLRKNLIAGAKEYQRYANELLNEIPDAYRDLAQNGDISIELFEDEVGEETLNAIQKYREWAQKAADANVQAEEALREISALAKQAIDNIANEYENKNSIPEYKKEQLEAYNEYIETLHGSESANVYDAMIDETEDSIKELQKQRNAMQAEFNEQVKNGHIKKGSQDWYDALNDIAEVDTEIINLMTDIEDYQDAINELHWDHFDIIMEQLEAVSEEAFDLIDILRDKDVVDDNGDWTKEGIAALGLYIQQMENAEVQADQYRKEIAYLNSNWKKLGYTEQEYIEKLNELKSGQYDAIKSYNDTKDAIVDLTSERVDAIKKGIEKEIEAYEELINKKKEALSADKDLHDFEKQVLEQQKEISDIERKLSALSADTSMSARAKRAQLEADLAEAKSELEEMYYDRSITDQQEALDKELENFQEEKDNEIKGWEEYLEETEQVVADSLSLVQSNTKGVYKTLQSMGEEYRLYMSEALTSPWKDGSDAIQDYSEKFKLSMSSTVEELQKIAENHKQIMKDIEGAGKDAVDQVDRNSKTYQNGQGVTQKKPDDAPEVKIIKVGSRINAGNAKIYSYAGAKTGEEQYYSNDPIYQVLAIDGNWFKVRHHKQSSGVTGWFKRADVKAYAKGTTGVLKDQAAIIDELGEELVMHAGKNGKLAFLTKGSAVIPHDISENLMNLGQLDPQDILDRSRPVVNAPHVVNNNIELNVSFGEIVHIDTVTNETVPNLAKTVEKQIDKYMKGLNAELRKYTR